MPVSLPSRRAGLLAAGLASAMALAGPVAAAPAAAASPPATVTGAWVSEPVPAGITGRLADVTASSATQAWAAGYRSSTGSATTAPLMLHVARSGDTISSVVSTMSAITWKGALTAVKAVSPSDVWATGTDSAKAARVIHWDGKTWSNVALPAGVSTVVTLSAALGHGPWLLASFSDGHTGLLHPAGSAGHWAWAQLATPAAPFTSTAIAQDPNGSVWLVGHRANADGSPLPQVYKYVSSRPRLATGSTGPAVLPASLIAGPDGLWVGGTKDSDTSTVEHWDGHAWTESTFTFNGLGGLAGPAYVCADAQGGPAWAMGTEASFTGGVATYSYDDPESYQKYTGPGTGGGVWDLVNPAPDPPGPVDLIPLMVRVAAFPGTQAFLSAGSTEEGIYLPRLEYWAA